MSGPSKGHVRLWEAQQGGRQLTEIVVLVGAAALRRLIGAADEVQHVATILQGQTLCAADGSHHALQWLLRVLQIGAGRPQTPWHSSAVHIHVSRRRSHLLVARAGYQLS